MELTLPDNSAAVLAPQVCSFLLSYRKVSWSDLHYKWWIRERIVIASLVVLPRTGVQRIFTGRVVIGWIGHDRVSHRPVSCKFDPPNLFQLRSTSVYRFSRFLLVGLGPYLTIRFGVKVQIGV